MTTTSRITLVDRFDEITVEVKRRTVRALDAAAETGKLEAERDANHPRPIARFTVVPTRGTEDGFASGVRAGPLVRIYDKGSLGLHAGPRKRGGKPEWEVSRGANPYTAHRGDVVGKGIAPRRILTPARAAGRKTLISRLLSR